MAATYLHTMVRVHDLEKTANWLKTYLGLEEIRRMDNESGRFTLLFMAPPHQHDAPLELTYNWDSDEDYGHGRAFGHVAYKVPDIYETCQKLMDDGHTIHRPPRDGHMAFVKTPDGISVELLQDGDALAPKEPWKSMENTGSW